MIRNKSDFRRYLEQDREKNNLKPSFRNWLFSDTWRFLRLLRQVEYQKNVKQAFYQKPYKLLTFYRFKKLSKQLGYSIPPNVFGPGLMLPHYGNIVVNRKCRIGQNCKVHVGVNIGAGHDGTNTAPTIGDNCYIAPGAKIFGGIFLGNNIQIGANAVVNKSFKENDLVLVGVPAKIVKKK